MSEARITSAESNQAALAALNRGGFREAVFRSMTRWRMILLTQCLDMITIIVISLLAVPIAGETAGTPAWRYLISAAVISIAAHFSFFQAGLYEMAALQNPLQAVKDIAVKSAVVFMMCAALAAAVHVADLFSRVWYAGFYIASVSAIGLERYAVERLVRAWIARGHHALSIAIVGGNELAAKLITQLEGNALGIRIIGVYDDRQRAGEDQTAPMQTRGTIADIVEYSKTHGLDMVVVTLPITAAARIQAVIRQLRQQPVNIRVLPGDIGLERMSPIRLGRTELPGIQLIAVADRPISEFAYFTKTIFDRLIAGMGLLAASPVLLGVALGIKLNSPGPVFFRQRRIGYKGREFDIIKFRTMHQQVCGSDRPTERHDSRIFGFGKLLRKTSLDELPQLINVLKGDMSVVGPRPHMLGQQVQGRPFLDAVAEYADRQRVKPGMTGWAQVNGWRGPAETVQQIEKRVEHDIYYIENWSLLFDLIIIVRTIFTGLHGKNAF